MGDLAIVNLDDGTQLYRGPIVKPRPRGNQTNYDPALAADLLWKISDGETLSAAALELGIERTNVLSWADDQRRATSDREGFGDRLIRARLHGCHAINDDLFEIADDSRNDWMQRNAPDNPGWLVNGDHVTRTRLRLDQRRFYLAKIAPKIFGDKLDLTVKPDLSLDTAPRFEDASPQQLDALEQIARLAQAAGVRLKIEGFDAVSR